MAAAQGADSEERTNMSMFVLVVFFILPLVGGLLALRAWCSIRSGLRVTGSIVGYKFMPSTGYKSMDRYLPIVVFRDEHGDLHTVKLEYENGFGYQGKLGPIRLIFPEGKPQAARVDQFFSLWAFPLFFLAPALATFAFLGMELLWDKFYG